ncbi:YfcL family protein [Colwellia psychrerythraea]|uniref:YfcL protein n=1 Tax=Colwellia psychrerythraea TaxID=28229 RepID=A0A099L065_COLPS|nr:YfcL family protein [Colwellia psychrerythraea]KGJ96374.1 YfcL protein [Colwellia psychrerythraea]
MPANSNTPAQTLTSVADFYQYLDDLFEKDIDSDTLFASGYLRGFLSLVATEFGDENQAISVALIDGVNQKISQAKTELSPQDHAIVTNFWLDTQKKIAL